MESRRPALAPTYEPPFPAELERERAAPRGITARLSLWWRHRKFLWRVLWISALLSTAVAFILPKHFRSTARLVVPDNQVRSNFAGLMSRATGAGGSSSALGLDPSSLLGLKTPGAFYVAVLQSRTVQDRLVQKFDLRAHYRKKYYQDARKRLDANTEIEEEKKSGVITLNVSDWDPNFAAMLARGYIAEADRVAAELNTSAAHLERVFLEERLQSARQDLARASMALSQFSGQHTVMDVQQQGRTMMDAVARLQGELIATEAELKGLQQIYSDGNVRVRTLRARAAELRSQLNSMVGSYTPPGDPGNAQDADTFPSVRGLSALGYRYQELYREAKAQETIVDFLTQQYETARVEEAEELPVLRVMDEPNVPEKKFSPIRSLVIGLSMIVALALAFWWLVAKEKWGQLPAGDSRRLLLAEVQSDLKAVFRPRAGGRRR